MILRTRTHLVSRSRHRRSSSIRNIEPVLLKRLPQTYRLCNSHKQFYHQTNHVFTAQTRHLPSGPWRDRLCPPEPLPLHLEEVLPMGHPPFFIPRRSIESAHCRRWLWHRVSLPLSTAPQYRLKRSLTSLNPEYGCLKLPKTTQTPKLWKVWISRYTKLLQSTFYQTMSASNIWTCNKNSRKSSSVATTWSTHASC